MNKINWCFTFKGEFDLMEAMNDWNILNNIDNMTEDEKIAAINMINEKYEVIGTVEY